MAKDAAVLIDSLEAERISQWFETELGQLLMAQELSLLAQQQAGLFGSYWLHYGLHKCAPINPANIANGVRLGPLAGHVDLHCEENAWPVCEHAADMVLLQHGLDFCQSPHALLREAAFAVRPGGHLLVLGFNPFSTWGARSVLSRGVLGQARCISAARLTDWLTLLGFALEKRVFGCYRPPLAKAAWQSRLDWCEPLGRRWNAPVGGFYILTARKLMAGLRPLKPSRREQVGQLLPLPVAKVTGRSAQSKNSR